MKQKLFFLLSLVIVSGTLYAQNPFTCGQSITDGDGNTYETVQVGHICWMKSNMKSKTYTDGVAVPKHFIYKSEYAPDTVENLKTYGRLYTWYSAVRVPEGSNDKPQRIDGFVQGVCPDGWHIPTIAEMRSLESYSTETLRSVGLWLTPNSNNNNSGFSAVPAGYYSAAIKRFEKLLGVTYFWTDSLNSVEKAYAGNINYRCNYTRLEDIFKNDALSVRCSKILSFLTLTTNDAIVCENGTVSVTYTATVVNDITSNYSFAWRVNGVDSALQTGNTLTVHYSADNVGTNTIECTATGSATSFTETVSSEITLINAPTISIESLTFDATDKKLQMSGKIPSYNDDVIIEYGVRYALNKNLVNATSITASNMGSDGTFSLSANVSANSCDTLYATAYVITKTCGFEIMSDTQFVAIPISESLALTASQENPIKLCANSTASVVYSATVTDKNGNDISSEYTFKWTVNGVDSVETGSKLTVNFTTAGKDTIKVVATHPTYTCISLKDSIETIVNIVTAVSTFSTCSDLTYNRVYNVNVTPVNSTVVWRNADGDSVGNWSSGSTQKLASGIYTVEVKHPTSGCISTNTINLEYFTNCTNMKNVNAFGNELTSGTGIIDSVKDHEGNVYDVVQIGNQCWLRENMRATTSPSTGADILFTDYKSDKPRHKTSLAGKMARWPNNNPDDYNNYYMGVLYNWNAAVDTFNTATEYGETYAELLNSYTSLHGKFSVKFDGFRRGICPAGWHVPSVEEWRTMFDSAGLTLKPSYDNYYISSPAVLATSCSWQNSNMAGVAGNKNDVNRNKSNFSIIPMPYSWYEGFDHAGQQAYFHTSDEGHSGCQKYVSLGFNSEGISFTFDSQNYKACGFAVRCLRDYLDMQLSTADGVICGETSGSTDKDPAVITYTANIATDEENANTYSYEWSITPSVDAGSVVTNGNTCTVSYKTAGTFSIACTATKGGVVLTDTVNSIITEGIYADITICTDDNLGIITIKNRINNPTSVEWYDGDDEQVGTWMDNNTIITGLYSDRIYKAIITSSTGCKKTRENITVAKQRTQCSVNNILGNERGSGSKLDSVSDHEGNWYDVVQIGDQCWLRENMRVTTSPISGNYLVDNTWANPEKTKVKPITNLSTSSNQVAHWYQNDSTTYAPLNFGLLYSWHAALDTVGRIGGSLDVFPKLPRRGICPVGWHIPTRAEWTTMELTAGIITQEDANNLTMNMGNASGKLAASCWWSSNNTDATPGNYNYPDRNITGLNIIPVGYINSDGTLQNAPTSLNSSTNPNGRETRFHLVDNVAALMQGNNYVQHSGRNLNACFSVRCIRDEISCPTIVTETPSNSDIQDYSATLKGVATNIVGDIEDYGFLWGTSKSDMSNVVSKSANNTSVSTLTSDGLFTANITIPTCGTIYWIAYFKSQNCPTTSYGDTLSYEITVKPFPACPGTPTVTDVEGFEYQTIQIGNQCWMKENLRTKKYADGEELKYIESGTVNDNMYAYPNRVEANVSTYGLLYNWQAAIRDTSLATSANPSNVQGICPNGWHLPSAYEFLELCNYIADLECYSCGNSNTYIGKALAGGNWPESSRNCAIGNPETGNNLTGFSVMPAGYVNGAAWLFTSRSDFQTTTRDPQNYNSSYTMELNYDNGAVVFASLPNIYSSCKSVRCVKNN